MGSGWREAEGKDLWTRKNKESARGAVGVSFSYPGLGFSLPALLIRHQHLDPGIGFLHVDTGARQPGV